MCNVYNIWQKINKWMLHVCACACVYVGIWILLTEISSKKFNIHTVVVIDTKISQMKSDKYSVSKNEIGRDGERLSYQIRMHVQDKNLMLRNECGAV